MFYEPKDFGPRAGDGARCALPDATNWAETAKSVALDVAIFSKSIDPDDETAITGLGHEFVVAPDAFDATFRAAATPPPEARWNEGLGFLDPAAARSGAWTVRVVGDFVYLACQRYLRHDPDAPHLLGRDSRLQTNHMEQVTFRVPSDVWQHHAAEIASHAAEWLIQTGPIRKRLVAGNPPQPGVDMKLASTPAWTAEGPVDFAKFPAGLGMPSVILHTRLLPHSNAAPLPALLASLTPDQLRWASFAVGYRVRFPGVSFQLFDQSRLRFADPDDPPGDAAYVTARARLMASTDVHNTSAYDLMPAVVDRVVGPRGRSADGATLRDRMVDFRTGFSRDLSAWTFDDLNQILRAFDTGMDVLASLGNDTAWLTDKYMGFMQSAVTTLGEPLPQLLARMSWLEFAPGFLSNLPGHSSRMVEPVLDALRQLRDYDVSAFDRITARMTQQDQSRPIFWRHLVNA
ncbi:MAG: hypothetical protein AAF631_09815 [Pseudomonadota bacterium]